jgi:hypothetical protein
MTHPTLFTSTLRPSKSVKPPPLRRGFLFAILSLGCFALLSSIAQAQDGNYGNGNTAEGGFALSLIVADPFANPGGENTAIGYAALNVNSSGDSNTAIGSTALEHNTTGSNNTATGDQALFNNNASNNTANGAQALFHNTTGSNNTASGIQALYSNTTGINNVAAGFAALLSNTTGHDNTASGLSALRLNVDGFRNTASGLNALYSNASGHDNTASGSYALYRATNGNNNTATGLQALLNVTTGSNNVGIGANAGASLTTGSNNIDIGAPGVAGESGKIRVGTKGTQKQTFIAGISGVTVGGGVGVMINANGQLGTVQSSARYKDDIKPMEKASESLLALKPVTFRYKHELDPDGIPQFGLVAEQVEKVNPDLIVRDEDGKVMTVRYEAVNAMLLNEFLKEHHNVQELKATVAQQQKQIEALTATVQKVSDQIALSKPAPQLVANP